MIYEIINQIAEISDQQRAQQYLELNLGVGATYLLARCLCIYHTNNLPTLRMNIVKRVIGNKKAAL